MDRFFALIIAVVLVTTAGIGAYAHATQGGWFGMVLAVLVPIGGLASWLRHRRLGGPAKSAADDLVGWLAFAVALYTFAVWP